MAYPDKTITIVVPTAAGGGNDAMARTIAQKLGPLLGQTVIVDNRAGANGAIASEFVSRAAPDGHTLMFGYIATHAMNPALQKLRYDPVADFAPIGLVGYSPTLMVANANVPVKDVRDLVAQLKAKPDKYTYASAGNGTAPHYAAELFKLNAGVVMLGAPYKGSAPAISDTIGGQTQFMFPSLYTALPHVKSGKLRALAVAGPKRSALLPDVPTLKEAGRRRRRRAAVVRLLRPRQDAQGDRRPAQQGAEPGAGRQGDRQAHGRARRRRRDQHARTAGRPGQERAGEVEGRGAAGQADRRVNTNERLRTWTLHSASCKPGPDAAKRRAIRSARPRSRRSTRRSTTRRCRPTPERRCRRCGTGCTSCRCTASREIGPDGHAKRGGFLPPVPLPRRMWAGSQFEFRSPLRVGDAVDAHVDHRRRHGKEGRTGKLVFVKVRHEVRCNGAPDPALVEFHDIVYREAPSGPATSRRRRSARETGAAWQREIVPDDVLLFRYSALTFNGHRIHYDRKYVTEVEGYPGPDRARAADRDAAAGPAAAQAARGRRRDASASRPCGRRSTSTRSASTASSQADGKTVRLWAQDHEGWLTMDATATLR